MTTGQAIIHTRWVLMILAGVLFAAAGLSGQRALSQALPAGVPAAPPDGIDAAKLPDTNGIHLGMSQNQALTVVKRLYPANLINIITNKEADGTTWILHISASKVQNCIASCDDIDVAFSPPPNPIQVIAINRVINSGKATPPTVDAVVASLRKKYGQELASVKAPIMTWAYDEQGQPINPRGPSNWSPADCAHAGGFELPGATPLAQILPRLEANLCNRGVFVTVQILPGAAVQGVPVAPQIFMFLGEKSLQFRDGVAAQQHVEALATAKKQREMKTAQQQKAPTL
jgi:hypothetical protein